MTPDELGRASDENLVRAFELVAPYPGLDGERRSFGAAEAVFIGIEHAFYNPVLALDPATTLDDVLGAIAWIRDRGREPSVQVREDLRPRFEAGLADLGYAAAAWVTPGMALHPIPAVLPDAPAELTIEVFGGGRSPSRADQRRLEDWHHAFGDSALFRRVMPLEAVSNPNLLFAVGHEAAGPVGCAFAARSATAVGIYAVGTPERARRRGYGTAMTWAAIDAGRRAWGTDVAVLQSSEMGLGLYSRMGFVEVSRYVEFDPPKPPAPEPTPQG